jgi:hypothetical protein
MSDSIERSRLDQLADEIGAEVGLAEKAWQSAVQHAITAGEKLIEVKSLVDHGEWLPWLEAHDLPRRTASRYMQLARKRATVAHLPTVREAVALLVESTGYQTAEEKIATFEKREAERGNAVRQWDSFLIVASGEITVCDRKALLAWYDQVYDGGLPEGVHPPDVDREVER